MGEKRSADPIPFYCEKLSAVGGIFSALSAGSKIERDGSLLPLSLGRQSKSIHWRRRRLSGVGWLTDLSPVS